MQMNSLFIHRTFRGFSLTAGECAIQASEPSLTLPVHKGAMRARSLLATQGSQDVL